LLTPQCLPGDECDLRRSRRAFVETAAVRTLRHAKNVREILTESSVTRVCDDCTFGGRSRSAVSNYRTDEAIAPRDRIVAFVLDTANHFDDVHIATNGGGYPKGSETYLR
jgi:hypothetical protein